MKQLKHKKDINEISLSHPSDKGAVSLEEWEESFFSNLEDNRSGGSTHKTDQHDTMCLSDTGSALDDPLYSGDNDHLFGKKMPKTLHWSIPWSDLMMTMFIFFAVMYVYKTSIDEVPSMENPSAQIYPLVNIQKASQPTEKETMQDLYDLSRERLKTDELRSVSSVELIPDKAVRIILTGDLLFDLGKADLREKARESLKEISVILRQTPYMVNLVGHTDDLPINTEQFPSNWELSTSRACQVARFLIEEMGIPEEKFFISGHASFQPIKPNDAAVDRAANRRVEIIITKERPYATAQGMDSNGAKVAALL